MSQAVAFLISTDPVPGQSVAEEDRATPGSPDWWLSQLLRQMNEPARPAGVGLQPTTYQQYRSRRAWYEFLWSYYTGSPPLPQIADAYRELFREEMRKSRSNYAAMPVNALVNRMSLQGVSTAADNDTDGDDVGAQIAEASSLVAGLRDLFTYLFVMGEAYAMVTRAPAKSAVTVPSIKPVDPRRAISDPDPNYPLWQRAALTTSWDRMFAQQRVDLYLPGWHGTANRAVTGDDRRWKWTAVEEVTGIDHLGGVPVVRLENPAGLGEFEPHLDVLDRIIDTTLQRLVLTKYQAFRQRAVSIDDPEPEDEEDEKEDIDWGEILSADPGAVWKLPGNAKFWESSQAELGPIVLAKRDDVKEFSAVSTTPLYLITPDAAQGSAEGASLMREGHNAKILDRRDRNEPALKLMWQIAFCLGGQPERAKSVRLHWGSIEFSSLADRGSASSQSAGTLSLRNRLVTIWGMSPADASENIQQLAAEQMLLPAGGSQQPSVPSNAPDRPSRPSGDVSNRAASGGGTGGGDDGAPPE